VVVLGGVASIFFWGGEEEERVLAVDEPRTPAVPVHHPGRLEEAASRREEVPPQDSIEDPIEDPPRSRPTIKVLVHDDVGQPVEKVKVLLVDFTRTQVTAADGATVFKVHRKKRPYKIDIVDESVPEGFFPPREEKDYYEKDGIPVCVDSNTEHEVELVLERGAFVFGKVVDPMGVGVEYARVRFSLLDHDLRSMYFNTEMDGSYCGTVYAGDYVACAGLGVAPGTPLSKEDRGTSQRRLGGTTLPLPQTVSLQPGSSTDICFRFGGGGSRILGTVLDEKGIGFGGLKVYVAAHQENELGHPARFDTVDSCVTDSAGRFSFPDLFPGRHKIHFDCDGFNPRAKPGQSTIGMLIQPVVVDLASSLELGPIIVPRAHPLRVRGTIAPQGPLSASFILSAGGGGWRRKDTTYPVDLGWDPLTPGLRTFDFWIERNEGGGTLLLRRSDGSKIVDSVTIPVTWNEAAESEIVLGPITF